MRFGYGLITCQRYPGDSRSDTQLYAEALDAAAEAERLGFDSVWTSEHHFADDAYMPSLLPVSAAIAARTSTIELGTGLLLAPLYPPLRLAEDVATVDAISGGRFILGLGMGWLDWEFEALGVPMSERVARMEAAVAACRDGWGQGLTREGIGVTPKPARPDGPPIWIGAGVDAAVRRAARIGDGFFAGTPTDEEFTHQVEVVRAERGRSADDDTFEIAGYWPVFVSPDGADAAWAALREHLHYMEWKYADGESAKGRLGELPTAPPLDAETEATIRSYAIFGSADEVAERIAALRDIAGERFTFVGRQVFPGMDPAVMAESTRRFAQEVIPKLR